MKSSLLSLASLIAVLAACGSQDGASPSVAGTESGQEVMAEDPVVAPDERETLIGRFITTAGEYVVDSAGEFEIHVVRENGLLNYRVQIRTVGAGSTASSGGAASEDEHSTTTGPKHAAINPNSNWFIHVESEHRYWVFDGASRVTLFEYTGLPRSSEVSMTDLKSSPDRLLAEMPSCVKDRIPADALAEQK